MKKKHIYTSYALVLSTLLVPAISFAALDGVKALLTGFGGLLGLVVPVIFGLALVFFFWTTAQFILHSNEPKAREEGKNQLIWSIIALFVMVSIYGILKLVGDTLGIDVKVGTPSSQSSGSPDYGSLNGQY